MKVSLTDICDFQGGTQPPKDEWIDQPAQGYVRMLQIRDFTQSDKNYIEYVKDTGKLKTCIEDDILIGRYGASIGKILTGLAGAYNVAIVKTIPDEKVVSKKYLYWYLNSQYFQRFISNVGSRAAQAGFNKNDLGAAQIPLVDKERQEEICEVLEKANKLISLRKQQLAKLDELVKARFVEMFGDPVKNTMDWEIKPLSELGELNRGVSKARPRNSPELLGGPYPLIQTGEVANAKTYITSFNSTYSEKGLAQSKMWPKGTLCITIAANIAQTSILTFDACFPDSVVGFISRNMTNELFIHYWFSFFQKILDEQAPQVAQKNINLKILSELNVIVPPLSLQNRFATFVERVDQQKQTVQQSLEKLELMKKALMQEYFG